MNILFVDDTEDNINLYKIFLKNYDAAKIDYLSDPVEAIKAIASGKYQLVFLDIEMPVKNGFDVIEEVGDIGNCTIYALTAYTDTSIIEQIGENKKFKDIVKKPILKRDLISIIDEEAK